MNDLSFKKEFWKCNGSIFYRFVYEAPFFNTKGLSSSKKESLLILKMEHVSIVNRTYIFRWSMFPLLCLVYQSVYIYIYYSLMVEVSRGDMSDSRLHQRNRQAASRVWTRQASPDTDVTPVGRTVDFQQLKA